MNSLQAKGIIVLIALAIISAVAYILWGRSLMPAYLVQPFLMLIAILIGLTFYYFIYGLSPAVKDEKLRFTLRKIAAIVGVAIILIGFLAIWVHEITILALSAGLVAAGVSFSLQQPITSLVGWLVIIFNRPFYIGDRIHINTVEGDVIDFNVFQVKLMEIGQWTNSNLYTGRILSVPTSWILTHSVYNYTQDFSFVWDRIWVGLLYGEDYEKVSDELGKIAEEFTRETVEEAEASYKSLSRKYFSHVSSFEPVVYLSFNSNWIELNVRYVTDARKRTATRSDISKAMLDYIYENGIKIASTSMNVNLSDQDKVWKDREQS